jgi:hypothetical protein
MMNGQEHKKLYRVIFHNGATRNILAGSMQLAGSQSTANDGSDIRHVDLLAVDCRYTGKSARRVARELTGISTRHMAAFPVKVAARMRFVEAMSTPRVEFPVSSLRIVRSDDKSITFKLGGAY